jgi:hypothetical protein
MLIAIPGRAPYSRDGPLLHIEQPQLREKDTLIPLAGNAHVEWMLPSFIFSSPVP